MSQSTLNRVTLAFAADNHLGETPVWSAAEQSLYWVNCEKPPQLHRWKPSSGAHKIWPMPQRIGGFALKAGGEMLLALADGLYDFTPNDGALTLRSSSPLPAQIKLHESAIDRQGRFWIGAYDHDFPANRQACGASFFRLDGNVLTPVITGIAVANGLAFSPDGRTLYAANSPTRTVEAWDLDPASGAISNRRTFLALVEGEGFVDGAAVDAEGGYWLANVAAGRLRRYLPNGTLERIIELPFSNPTKLTFGGPELKTIYVTSTRLTMQCFIQPTAPNGHIYTVDAGVSGLEEPLFAG